MVNLHRVHDPHWIVHRDSLGVRMTLMVKKTSTSTIDLQYVEILENGELFMRVGWRTPVIGEVAMRSLVGV